MTIACCICGSKDWIACDPGTSADATRFVSGQVAEIRPSDERRSRAWCLEHWQQCLVRVPVRGDEPSDDDLFDLLRVEDAKVALSIPADARLVEAFAEPE